MKIYDDGTCRYRGVTYSTLREALAALWPAMEIKGEENHNDR